MIHGSSGAPGGRPCDGGGDGGAGGRLGQAAAAAGAATDERYYQAAVNLLDPEAPGAAGFVRGVSFSAPLGGPTSVSVFVSRATTVACEDFATLSLRTPTDEATAPGPVYLDIDHRLLTAEGVALVDLLEEHSRASHR